MTNVTLFLEDVGHEEFVGALVRRIAHEQGVKVRVHVRTARGGRSQVLAELGEFIDGAIKGYEEIPDYLVVAVDSNCQGAGHWRQLICEIVRPYLELYPDSVILAVPDPHIERWFLLDSAAFKTVLGRGCNAPDYKCEKDRYKDLLANSVREAGVEPLMGGIEYAEELVQALDIARVRAADSSLGTLIQRLQQALTNSPA